MSNEPKWDKRLVELLPQRASDTINLLQQENAELRELLENVHGLRVDPVSRIATIHSTTPRTDADGLADKLYTLICDKYRKATQTKSREIKAEYRDLIELFDDAINQFRKEGEQNG